MRVESTSGFILDLGGGPASFFAEKFPKREQVILVDIDYRLALKAKTKQANLNVLVADGGNLPFANQGIALTICNSVIEHVDRPDKLATEIQRVSKAYFLQTPNGRFPFETHSFIAIPFYNFIPWAWLKKRLCQLFGASFEYVSSVHYVPEQELRHLFPKAQLSYEKFLGLHKSFYIQWNTRKL